MRSRAPTLTACCRVVLVGDPQQLPATILSKQSRNLAFDRSLFERLMQAGWPVKMLSVQYRMHPHIRRFPSNHFYNGNLQVRPRSRCALCVLSPVRDECCSCCARAASVTPTYTPSAPCMFFSMVTRLIDPRLFRFTSPAVHPHPLLHALIILAGTQRGHLDNYPSAMARETSERLPPDTCFKVSASPEPWHVQA